MAKRVEALDEVVDGVLNPPPDRNKRKIILNAFVMNTPTHHNFGQWRNPADKTPLSDQDWNTIDYWVNIAKVCEKGKFHALFIADTLGAYDIYNGPDNFKPSVRSGAQFPVNDPLLLVPALSYATESIGFGVTASTTYDHPYELARRFSTADHLSNGRVGWNIVTSYLESAAKNHGLHTQVEHDERYQIADEYLEVVYKLWEGSWHDKAVTKDVERNVYADPEKVRAINHKGKYFKVPGPHITAPSKQRTPFLFQAGLSVAGKNFGAKHAEGIFVTGDTPALVRKSVDDLRKKAQALGRDPYSLKTILGITVITAATDEEAQAKADEYTKYIDKEAILVFISGGSGFDLGPYSDDFDLRDSENLGLANYIKKKAIGLNQENEKWTKWKLAESYGLGNGSPVIIGGPETVTDKLLDWVDEGDVDGFNLKNLLLPGSYEDFIEYVVPELQKRNRFWTDYDVPKGSIRENVYGTPGNSKLRHDHPAYVKYNWETGTAFHANGTELTHKSEGGDLKRKYEDVEE
ncbi:hypothetical protein AWJ20_198 [Sugiyamaella lignohabitans]|uniref:Luciferase-like domain-containing protein n=1 Tax=Sugiyamaella lignohabitans TaxID=796027 RepID=A0A167CQ17_9ASCO|nr:uncharacterized protein AWJ20_198 [Sugiyamaella lignohabitans]ANB11971.1 hypothetical protein AWJ20_198 [Sugiyamaella lignohabitans]